MISLNTLNIFFISITSRDTLKRLKVFFSFLGKGLFWLTISESTVHHHEEGMVAEGAESMPAGGWRMACFCLGRSICKEFCWNQKQIASLRPSSKVSLLITWLHSQWFYNLPQTHTNTQTYKVIWHSNPNSWEANRIISHCLKLRKIHQQKYQPAFYIATRLTRTLKACFHSVFDFSSG